MSLVQCRLVIAAPAANSLRVWPFSTSCSPTTPSLCPTANTREEGRGGEGEERRGGRGGGGGEGGKERVIEMQIEERVEQMLYLFHLVSKQWLL